MMWYQTLIGPVCKPPVVIIDEPPKPAPVLKYKSEKQMAASTANRMKAVEMMKASRQAGIDQLKSLCKDWTSIKDLVESTGRGDNNLREILRECTDFESKTVDIGGGRFKCKMWRVRPDVQTE